MHQCEKCNKKYARANSLIRHVKMHDNSYICTACTKCFAEAASLNEHTVKYNGTCKTPCNICKKTFIGELALRRHMRMHQQWPPRICERCGQRFVVESTFQRHMKHCGKMGVHAFNRICKNLASLEKHQVNCRKVPSSSKCDICEKNFAHRSNLNRHMKLHERGTAHKCEVCHISYARQADLKRHMLRHDDNQASFACTVCDKVYQQKYLLSRHMVVHTKEGRFQCSICDQTFSQKSALKNHAKVHAKIKAGVYIVNSPTQPGVFGIVLHASNAGVIEIGVLMNLLDTFTYTRPFHYSTYLQTVSAGSSLVRKYCVSRK